jgi:hypothetical protein
MSESKTVVVAVGRSTNTAPLNHAVDITNSKVIFMFYNWE